MSLDITKSHISVGVAVIVIGVIIGTTWRVASQNTKLDMVIEQAAELRGQVSLAPTRREFDELKKSVDEGFARLDSKIDRLLGIKR